MLFCSVICQTPRLSLCQTPIGTFICLLQACRGPQKHRKTGELTSFWSSSMAFLVPSTSSLPAISFSSFSLASTLVLTIWRGRYCSAAELRERVRYALRLPV